EARGGLVSLPASRAARAELGLPAPDYVHDVAPVLAAHCQRCHRPGGIGPWAMTGYEVVRGWAPMMREVIRTRRMPPWHADPDASALRSDLPLSVAEAQAIVHWAEEGARRGDGDDPLAIPLPEAPVWPLGEPDLLFTLPEQKVPANGVIPYRHVETDLGLTEPTWICAAQVAAGNRGALHHANVLHVDSDMIASGRRGAALWQNNLLSSYVPGMYEGDVWPSGTGRLLLPGEKLRTTLHYNTTGKRERDVTRIGLYRCESPPERVYRVKAVLDMDLTIPAGAVMDHVASWRPDGPIRIFRIFPHMHYRGAAFTLEVETPDGDRRTLLRVPRYDFGWQRWYDLAAPVDLPAGSTVIATTTFDNTAENPANPDPGRAVPWGEQSDDEMAIGYVAWEAL
ncbi:MAG TPA: cytochrome c, partial [Myxococcota bacterium]|nr:cytochrome c [Myxococcota bacterium]